ncbi:MAG: hypothetical protein ACYSUT_05895 [Planctomycetota bacterium]|jgi:hypothetical protein
MFASETIPTVLFGVLLFFVPESPRWLGPRHDFLYGIHGNQQAGQIESKPSQNLIGTTSTLNMVIA